MWRKRLGKALGGLLFGVCFAALVAELGARVLVAQSSLPNRMPADIFAAHAIGWARFWTRTALAYLDLLPVLREHADSTGTELYFASNDVHRTPEGRDVVTDALYGWLAVR